MRSFAFVSDSNATVMASITAHRKRRLVRGAEGCANRRANTHVSTAASQPAQAVDSPTRRGLSSPPGRLSLPAPAARRTSQCQTKEGLQGRLTSAPAGANTGLAPHYSEGYQCLARRAHTQSVAASAVVKKGQGGGSERLTQLALCITRRWSRTLGGELAQRLASQTRPAWCRPVRQRQQTRQ